MAEERENLTSETPLADGETVQESGRGKKRRGQLSQEEQDVLRDLESRKSRSQKEWEDGLIATKRVKREEIRRKWKTAMLILLIFSLISTSVVYVMLLFLEQNNIRITATSTQDKSISLSTDRVTWTPYLDIKGPDSMWNISYNPNYNLERIPTLEEMERIVLNPSTVGGNWSKTNMIEFCFFLRNTSSQTVPFRFDMLMASNDKGLENCMRIIWADSSDTYGANALCYAARSDDNRLAYNNIDALGSAVANGGVEKIAYPIGVENFTAEDFIRYEEGMVRTGAGSYGPINLNNSSGTPMYSSLEEYFSETGFVNTVPFKSREQIFERNGYLNVGEVMCIYVCVWIEGSDYDCVDSALGGYITLSINFTVT